MKRLRWLAVLLIAIFYIAGCAINSRARGQNDINIPSWQGRLSMQVQSDPNDVSSQAQSVSSAFALQGDEHQGKLSFYAPLGSTVAEIDWTPGFAQLKQSNQSQTFNGLAPLVQQLLGTDVPIEALFAWLNGQAASAAGWEVNLSQWTQGRIFAQRQAPLPQAHLRIILDH